ncbi:hypothetical protein MKW92_040364 [Papaver armeniacum]|nr:hypothetical protein MKW92_040364 [Papaver armeniacum]
MGAASLIPPLAMTLVQLGYAISYVFAKLAMNTGMNPFVLIAYRQIFSTVMIAPLAMCFERGKMPKLTKRIFWQLVLCSVIGTTLSPCLYYLGLKYSTPTIASALDNLKPAITFLMAIPFKMEKVGIKSLRGQAKVMGTVICVGGAMIMSFYKGSLINIGESSLHWRYAEQMAHNNSGGESSSILVFNFDKTFLQTKMNKQFVAPYSTTAISCGMASFQCVAVALTQAHATEAWSLTSRIRLIASLCSAAFASALALVITSWCIAKRGPLYASMFSPLLLIIAALIGWGILDEKLYVGSAVGSVLIVIGLYAVLWGKAKEVKENATGMTTGNEDGGDNHEAGNGDIESPKILKENSTN